MDLRDVVAAYAYSFEVLDAFEELFGLAELDEAVGIQTESVALIFDAVDVEEEALNEFVKLSRGVESLVAQGALLELLYLQGEEVVANVEERHEEPVGEHDGLAPRIEECQQC